MSEIPNRPEAGPGRRERRKQEIRGRLLEAARALFEEKGFAATTVDEICDRADVAQKTFFNHFPTKHEIVREIAEAFFDEMGALIEEARKRPGSTAGRLAQVDGPRPDRTRRFQAAFRALLEDGAAAGELTPDHAVAFLTEMVVGAFTTILLNWQTLEGYSLREHLDEAARFLGRAIARGGR